MVSTLVLVDTYEPGERACWGPFQPIKLGWKADDKVFWWGTCTQSALDELLDEWEADGAAVEIVDKRRRIEV